MTELSNKPTAATAHRRLAGFIITVLLAALLVAVWVGRKHGSLFRKTEQQLEQVSLRLHESERHLDEAHIDLEALFGEIVGNLEHKYIPLDRSTRLPLRRGQAICQRIATQAKDPIRQASAYCTLGHINYHLHDLKASRQAYRSAIEAVSAGEQTAQLVHIRAYAANHLVHVLATLGYEQEALQLCQQTQNTIQSIAPRTFALLDELAFALRNQAILLAENLVSDASITLAENQLALLDELVRVQPADLSLVERQIDAGYLLAGLQWRTDDGRPEAIELLQQVAQACTALWQDTRQRMQNGESFAGYARYKTEAARAKRELQLATQTLANGDPGSRQPAFWTRKNLFLGRRSIGTEILLDDLRMPAEFEEQEAMLLKWSGREWQDEFTIKLVRELLSQVEIFLLVDDFEAEVEAREALTRHAVSLEKLRFYQVAANTLWIRDFGPLTVFGSEGFPIWIDYEHLRPDDFNHNDLFTDRLGRLTGHRVIRSPLLLEGGNVLSNGEGLLVCTRQLEVENRELGFAEKQLHRRLRSTLGCSQLIVLDQLEREGTGHVDWFLTFVSPTTVVVGEYAQSADPGNAAVLDRNAARLSKLTTNSGPLNVVRVPMPPHPPGGFGGTYTNVVFANGKLIVPTWKHAGAEMNREALAVYRKILPSWDIVPLDCSDMLANSGAVHCQTVNIPKMPATKLPSVLVSGAP